MRKARLINNADDFGYSNSINYGIIDSYHKGLLNSTTIMSNMDGFYHAVKLAKENSGLAIGVHCTLTCGKPVLENHKTLIDTNGNFKNLSFYHDEKTTVDDEEIYLEWKAQIDRVINSGIKPTHLDSHHHSHTLKNNTKILLRLAKEYNIPVRNVDFDLSTFKENDIKCNSVLINPWEGKSEEILSSKDITKSLIEELKRKLDLNKDKEIIEIMWHPAYMDINIMTKSRFNIPRIYEVDALGSRELAEYINENFILCTYREI